MKTIMTATLFAVSILAGFGADHASAESLNKLESACRTGDYAACSRYNRAIVANNGGQSDTYINGYDPFAIVPASHAERTPTVPASTGADAAGEGGLAVSVIEVVQ